MNKNFYPTPTPLIEKMVAKIQTRPGNILEPSAGKGDILEYIRDSYNDKIRYANRLAIENDQDLRATLRGKGIKVIDSDFLAFAGPDKFDLIIGNPPFDNGDKHLLKAIDIMYRGEIIFLLNAETIKNPHTNTRKLLGERLAELNADVEYIKNGFMLPGTERKTAVEVALVYINIQREVEDDLFAGVDDKADELKPD
ncbi:methyltransferase, partial [Candidatus Pacearchaeota archaeon]|nr:methyltransferase [Candidatus Pacearchaeota archaeon]